MSIGDYEYTYFFNKLSTYPSQKSIQETEKYAEVTCSICSGMGHITSKIKGIKHRKCYNCKGIGSVIKYLDVKPSKKYAQKPKEHITNHNIVKQYAEDSIKSNAAMHSYHGKDYFDMDLNIDDMEKVSWIKMVTSFNYFATPNPSVASLTKEKINDLVDSLVHDKDFKFHSHTEYPDMTSIKSEPQKKSGLML